MSDARGLIVCGRCCKSEFGVGDVFTGLRSRIYKWDPSAMIFEVTDEDLEVEVRLRVDEIGFYHTTVEHLGKGHAAGIRFGGDGIERIEGLDLEAESSEGKVWYLHGE